MLVNSGRMLASAQAIEPRMLRCLATALLATTLIAASRVELRLTGLSGNQVDPLAAPQGTRAIVLLFLSVDCPISNKYAPEVRRLHDAFAPQGVVFRLIYPNPAESAESIRVHLSQYGYRGQALRDPRHELVKQSQATITPEAVVYDATGRLLYRGRIDDRFVSPGLQRPRPTRRDLEDALSALLAGRPVPQASAPAVGCFIADFAP
jgi:hypothetical protein